MTLRKLHQSEEDEAFYELYLKLAERLQFMKKKLRKDSIKKEKFPGNPLYNYKGN